jgi:hypothetical protein
MKSSPQMLAGTLVALPAGLMWGLVFIAPLLLPEYPAALQSFAVQRSACAPVDVLDEAAPTLSSPAA